MRTERVAVEWGDAPANGRPKTKGDNAGADALSDERSERIGRGRRGGTAARDVRADLEGAEDDSPPCKEAAERLREGMTIGGTAGGTEGTCEEAGGGGSIGSSSIGVGGSSTAIDVRDAWALATLPGF